jgi:uncharacterized peroxidase-related enzyme
MSWVDEVDLPDLPAIFQVLSLNSDALDAVRGLNETLAFGNSTLSRAQEEAIATVVAVANQCRYGALTHGGFLRRHSGDSDLASQLLSDYTQADLPPEDLQMLDFALKVTLEPASLTKHDVAGLRDVGFEDREIVSIVLITCLFNFMNRVACSLGVQIPSRFQKVVESWLTGPAAEQAWLLNPGVARGNVPSPASTAAGRGTTEVTDQEPAPPEDDPEPTADVETAAPRVVAPPAPPPPKHTPLERFVMECCIISGDQASPAKDLYIAYIRWCDEKREHTMQQRNFGLGLAGLGFRRRRRGQGRHWWMGIAVAPIHIP